MNYSIYYFHSTKISKNFDMAKKKSNFFKNLKILKMCFIVNSVTTTPPASILAPSYPYHPIKYFLVLPPVKIVSLKGTPAAIRHTAIERPTYTAYPQGMGFTCVGRFYVLLLSLYMLSMGFITGLPTDYQ